MNAKIPNNYSRISGSMNGKSVRGSWIEKRNALLKVLPVTNKKYIEFGSLNGLFYKLEELQLVGQNIIYFLDDPDLIDGKLINYLEANNSILYFGGAKALPMFSKLKHTKVRYVCFSSLLPLEPIIKPAGSHVYYYGKLDAFRTLQRQEIVQSAMFTGKELEIDYIDEQLPPQLERRAYLHQKYNLALGLHDRKHQNCQFYTGRIFNAIAYGIRPVVSSLSWVSWVNTMQDDELRTWMLNKRTKFINYLQEDAQ